MSVNLADVAVPPRCEQMIRAGALVVVNSSGGKDSQAMTIVLSRIVAREQLLVVHAPLGEVEWPGTVEHIEATLPDGVPLFFAPVSSGKSLLDQVEERGKFPRIRQRWCTASNKRGPIERELRRYPPTLRWIHRPPLAVYWKPSPGRPPPQSGHFLCQMSEPFAPYRCPQLSHRST